MPTPTPPYSPLGLAGSFDPRVLADRLDHPVPPGRNRPPASRSGGRDRDSGRSLSGWARVGLGALALAGATVLIAALVASELD